MFDDIFENVLPLMKERDYKFESGHFKIWQYDEKEVYMLHKPSGLLIAYCDFVDVGSGITNNACNMHLDLDLDDYRKFARMIEQDIKGNEISDKPIYPEMEEYAIERNIFVNIFENVISLLINIFDIIGELSYETEIFKAWVDKDEEVYMLHKPSGLLINYYKLYHLGRTNTCNMDISLDYYRKFANMLKQDIREYIKRDEIAE